MDIALALRPSNAVLASALIIALLADLAYPEHRGLLLKIHPVHTCFVMAKALGKPYSSRARGIATWIACVSTHLAPYAALLIIAGRLGVVAQVLISAYIAKVSMSIVLLTRIVDSAREAAERGDWDEARRWVQLIVRRDVSKLSEPHVISAAVESLAESLVDGFTSPLLYFCTLGPLGALLQRLANTMDGALGFKSEEYRNVGWFSARADTLLNFVPARLTALSIILAAALLGLDWRRGFRTWIRYRRATESVNAGHPMSAMAGILGVKLEKPGFYSIGDGDLPRAEQLRTALRIAWVCCGIWISTSLVALLLPYLGRYI
ncbi:MAG: cobalamin biosynthesis protein [Crenarchaeota archaeon]|nr:cobalamin biosynthesis protein [Thermoproteota archaeon]